MRKNSNYNSDFIEMQRTSFCWFIAEGLSQQLSMFSHISDFSKNTEYLLFGNEYFLLKPRYNILTSKKLKTNYTIQSYFDLFWIPNGLQFYQNHFL